MAGSIGRAVNKYTYLLTYERGHGLLSLLNINKDIEAEKSEKKHFTMQVCFLANPVINQVNDGRCASNFCQYY